MIPSTIFLALAATYSTLTLASMPPTTSDNSQQITPGDVQPQPDTALYTILSATIHQYKSYPASSPKNRRLRARQSQSSGSTPSNGNTGQAVNTTNNGIQAPYVPITIMEDFNVTVAQGPSASNGPSTLCTLTWDAGTANSGTRDHIANEIFNCTGDQVAMRMERRNVTPMYGFYIFVQMSGSAQAAWMVKDLNKTPGWTTGQSDDTFAGPAELTTVPNMTLADFLGAGQ